MAGELNVEVKDVAQDGTFIYLFYINQIHAIISMNHMILNVRCVKAHGMVWRTKQITCCKNMFLPFWPSWSFNIFSEKQTGTIRISDAEHGVDENPQRTERNPIFSSDLHFCVTHLIKKTNIDIVSCATIYNKIANYADF